jgi:predicted small secreted protein
MNRLLPIIVLIAASLLLSTCRSNTTTVRGKVVSDNKPVVGAEVRFGPNMNEATTTTNHDGLFTITATHGRSDVLELKVLKPGYTHDKIEFPASGTAQREFDVVLKRVFDPAAR